jgi:hypothetical protein
VSDFRTQDPYLAIRYGLKKSRVPSWVWSAIIFAIIGLGWLIWSANFHSRPELNTNLISYNRVDAHHLKANFSFTSRGSGAKFSCLITASDNNSNLVGELVVHLPDADSGKIEAVIPTSAPATVAQIDSCSKN